MFGFTMVLLLLTVTPALGAGRQDKERAARKACLNGDYAKGIGILSDLFVDSQDPTYIFNQGRCLEQNHRYQEAIERFREFLRTGETLKLKPEDAASAEKHIAACKETLGSDATQVPTAPAPLAPPPPAVVPPIVAPPPESAPSVVLQPESQHTSGTSGSGLRIAGILTAAFGVAALGAGVGFNVVANNTISEMESTKDGYSSGKDSTHDTYVTLAWVGYGVGAACIVTGAVLYGLGVKARSTSSSNVAIVPTVGAGQAGAALVGAF
jgi:hypothetical protein